MGHWKTASLAEMEEPSTECMNAGALFWAGDLTHESQTGL